MDPAAAIRQLQLQQQQQQLQQSLQRRDNAATSAPHTVNNGNGNSNKPSVVIGESVVVPTLPAQLPLQPGQSNGHVIQVNIPQFKIPLPPWLQAVGEKRHSEKQLASTSDLSKIKKKYRQSLCMYCARIFPQSPWATIKSRKYEHEIFKKHEKSSLHQRALVELNKSVMSAASSTGGVTNSTSSPRTPSQSVVAALTSASTGSVGVSSKGSAPHVVNGLGSDSLDSRGSKLSKAAVTAELGLSQPAATIVPGAVASELTRGALVVSAEQQQASYIERELAQRAAMAIPVRSMVNNDLAARLQLSNPTLSQSSAAAATVTPTTSATAASSLRGTVTNAVPAVASGPFSPTVSSAPPPVSQAMPLFSGPTTFSGTNGYNADNLNGLTKSMSHHDNPTTAETNTSGNLEANIAVSITTPSWVCFSSEICTVEGVPISHGSPINFSTVPYRLMSCKYCSSFSSSPTDWSEARLRPYTNETFTDHSGSVDHERAMIALELAQLSKSADASNGGSHVGLSPVRVARAAPEQEGNGYLVVSLDSVSGDDRLSEATIQSGAQQSATMQYQNFYGPNNSILDWSGFNQNFDDEDVDDGGDGDDDDEGDED
jgi:hypothetical protein